ncbi:hypothetical protein RHGRI_023401 [Rhododendron griersonianum]|uniref:Uncharacterized protein n=1 Tax=Rhododendron griersonianum TaxID=479676 RepID=A0AAV6J6S7_9ERIC|nr:hypothetical protein RHGRI_023401 [Rhododendron griersonianum]
MTVTSSAVVSNSDMAVVNKEIIVECMCMHQMSYEMEFQEEEMRKMMNPRINRLVFETAGVLDNYDVAHNAINDSFLELAQKAKPIIDSYISSLGEFGVEQCSTAREVHVVAFLFSITGYPRWGWVFYTTNEAMNAAQLCAFSIIVPPPPSQPMSPPPPLQDEPPEPPRNYLYIPQGSWRDRKDDA